MELKNKVIVITGGSNGFGKALGKAFIKEGAKVIVGSNNNEELSSVKEELKVETFFVDVTSYDSLKKFSEEILNKYIRIDFWINNAGIQIAPSKIEDVNIDKLHQLFDVNFFGYFYGFKIILPVMKRQGGGTIISIDSTAGLEGKPWISAYSSSKFAIKGLIESARKENLDNPIQILGIYPGGMQTDIYKEKYPEDFADYMKIDYAVGKVMDNLKLNNPEIDLVIRRPNK